MHAPPHFRISVRRFGVWRFATAGVAGCATAASTAWLMLSFDPGAWMTAAVAAAGILVVAGSARPVPAFALQWDTQVWQLEPEQAGGQKPLAGRVEVAIDLGNWMLLRFRPAAAPRQAVWLPMQRQGHEADWQALRRTVYGARALPVMHSTLAAE
jgi:hypothetical protein